MTLDDLTQAMRLRTQDINAPYLWSDDELHLFLNEAQNEAAERAMLLLDISTTEICQISVTAGTATYDLDHRIIKIARAKMDLGDHPLVETSVDQLDSGGTGWFPSGVAAFGSSATWYPGGSDWETLTGDPERFIQNSNKSITLVRIPVTDDTLRMRVYRLPLEPMSAGTDVPEIASQYHYRMLDWALRCAYLKQDSETLDKAKAADYEAAFVASFGVRPDANVQRKRREHRNHAVRMGAW